MTERESTIAKVIREDDRLVIEMPRTFEKDADELEVSCGTRSGEFSLAPPQPRQKMLDFFEALKAFPMSEDEVDEFGRIMDEIVADRRELRMPRAYRPTSEILAALRAYIGSISIPDADPDAVQAIVDSLERARRRPRPTLGDITHHDAGGDAIWAEE
ncbi:MAG: hypothetical protein QM589_02940 [Thermomicrobiales bacterium]